MSKKSILGASLLTLMVTVTASYNAFAVFDQGAIERLEVSRKARSVALTALRTATEQVKAEGDTSAEGQQALRTMTEAVDKEAAAVQDVFKRLGGMSRAETYLEVDHDTLKLNAAGMAEKLRGYEEGTAKLERAKIAATDPMIQDIIMDVQRVYAAMIGYWKDRADRFTTSVGGALKLPEILKGRFAFAVSPDERELFGVVQRALRSSIKALGSAAEEAVQKDLHPSYASADPFMPFSLDGDVTDEELDRLFSDALVRNIYWHTISHPTLTDDEVSTFIAKSTVSVYRKKNEVLAQENTVLEEELLATRGVLTNFEAELKGLYRQVAEFREAEIRRYLSEHQDEEAISARATELVSQASQLRSEASELDALLENKSGFISERLSSADAAQEESEEQKQFYTNLSKLEGNDSARGELVKEHMAHIARVKGEAQLAAEKDWESMVARRDAIHSKLEEIFTEQESLAREAERESSADSFRNIQEDYDAHIQALERTLRDLAARFAPRK